MKTSKTTSLSWQNKLISTALAAVSLFLGAPQLALATVPSTASTNMTPISGGVTAVATGTSQLVVTATAANSVVQWQSFSDGTQAGGLLSSTDAVTFSLPSSSSAILNNIVGSGVSVLNGSIVSNGRVFFLNPNGIIVSNGAVINAASFYASTVADPVANSYFANNGTLSVFNGGTPSGVGGTGIIYVQSGAQVNVGTPGVAGTFGLASAASTAVTLTNNINATNSFTGTSWTLNTSNSAPNAAVSGISVDSLSVSNGGNTTIYTYGGDLALGNSNTSTALNTPNSGVYYGITPVGGNVNVYTNGGNITMNGNVTAGTSLVLNTANSYTGGAYGSNGAVTANGNVVSYGSLSIATNGGNITMNNNSATTAAVNVVNNGTSTLNAGTAGNIQVYGDFSNLTTANGKSVVISLSSPSTSSRTIGTIISGTGDITVNSNGNLTVTKVTDKGSLYAQSLQGSITIGSATGSSTVSGGTQGTQSTVSGLNGANLNNITFSKKGVAVTTSNTDSSGVSGSISATTITVNGATSFANNSGGITITGYTESGGTYNDATNHSLTVTSGNGAVSLTNVTANGNVTISSASPGGNIPNALTISSLVNNAPILSGNSVSFTTNNGNIAITGLTTVVAPVSATTGNGSFTDQQGSITLTGTSTQPVSIGGSLTLNTGNGNITVSGISMVLSNASNTNNAVTLTANTANNNIIYNGGLSDVYITVNTVNQGLAAFSVGSSQSSPNYGITAAGLRSSSGANANSTGNSATTQIVVSSTGNVWVTNNLLATQITLASTAGILTTQNVDSTLGNTGSNGIVGGVNISTISLTSNGDVSLQSGTTSIGGVGIVQGPSNGISLTSSSGNVVIGAYSTANVTASTTNCANVANKFTYIASTGNIYINAAITTNGLTLSAPLGLITENTASGLITNSSTRASAYINGATISLPNANNFTGSSGTLKLTGGNATLNSNTKALTLTGLSLTGNLNLTTAAGVTLGSSTSDKLSVTGITSINTANSAPTSGAVSFYTTLQAASQAKFTGNVNITTNASSVQVGSSNVGGTFGTISVTSYNVNGTVNNGSVAIYSTGALDLGTITATSLNVTSNSNITNSIGAISNSLASSLSAGGTTPGSITLGTVSPVSLIGTTIISQASNLNISGNASGIVGDNNTLSSVTLTPTNGLTYTQSNGSIGTLTSTATASAATLRLTNVPVTTINATSSTGAITISTMNGSIGNITATTYDGALTFTSVNTVQSTATGSFQTTNGAGAMIINASGTNSLAQTQALSPNYTYNLGNSTASNSSILNNGSFTISNLVSSSASTGTVTVSANAYSTGSVTTAATGTGTLTLGTGIVLSGNQNAIYTSGNATLGTVTDTATSNVFMYSGNAQFVGRTISLAQTGSQDNLPYVAFTSNGSVKYLEQGQVVLNGLILGSAATSATLQSVTGNIVQGTNAGNAILTGNSSTLSFTGGGTNGGVVLNNASNVIASITSPSVGGSAGTTGSNSGSISITATGNSTITNSSGGGDITLSTLNIQNGGNGGTLTISNAGGNIVQGSQSAWIYGDVSLTTTSATSGKNDITFASAGNNFGKLTIQSTGNALVNETGTSVYTKVATSKNFSATSAQGDIALATINTAFNIDSGIVAGGYANFTATTGNISLTQSGSAYNTALITLVSAGNASIGSNDANMYLGATTNVQGNLTVTLPNTNSSLYDQSITTSGLYVGGIFTSISKNLSFANYLDQIGGLFTTSGGTNQVNVRGNLSLIAGSTAGNAYYTASGNITNTNTLGLAASSFNTLTLATSIGNVTIGGPVSITGLFTVYAPLGTVNLSNLSKSVDLKGVSPTVTSSTYLPPNP